MFTPLHSSMNQELLEKYVCNQSSHYEKYDGTACPSYHLKLKNPFPFSVSLSMFNLLHSSMNQKLFEKHCCDQGSHYENHGRFLLHKGSHHVQPPNQCFSQSAKMNGTQRRTLKNTLNVLQYTNKPLLSEKIKPVALTVTELR